MTGSILRQLLGLLGFSLSGTLIGYFTQQSLLLFTLFGILIWALFHIFWTAKLVEWSANEFTTHEPSLPLELGRVQKSFTDYRETSEAEFDEIHADMDQFQAATAAMEDAVVIIDKDDRMEWWNNSAEELLELTIEQKYKPVPEVFSDPNFIAFYQNADKNQSFKNPSNDQQFMLEFSTHSFGDGNRVLIARDITENEKFEQMRHTFLANASHELRTPITVIHGYLETLQEQELPKPIERAIRTMQSQSNRMVALISDLLTLSRLETSSENKSRLPIHITTMLNNMVEEAKALSGNHGHSISLSIDEGFDILGNEGEVRSALSNLVFNAVRYTPDGGAIDIKFEASANGAVFSVTDTGVGIAAEHIPRITERFYRVDEGRSRDSGGTGLGLAIVKHVLVRHNAKLGVSSKPGEGSRFSVTFPAERVSSNP